ncbi:hypothetical protein ANO14919_069530 [Xylariales sp. No.14919]|nr:hypothetical protein ANO14919_069530 [Xylariales sp. No.14919]
MPPQATATSGEPSSSTNPPHKESRRRRNRRRHVKKTAEARLQVLTVPPHDVHAIPVANRLVAAIEAKIPYNTPTSGEGKASRVRFNRKERHEIYELRLAIRALIEIPESEFVAAFSAAPGGLPAPLDHRAV